MEAVYSNFGFLTGPAPRLARLGALAERYFVDDAATALVKLRQLGEFLAKDMAAHHGLLPSTGASFDDALRALRAADALPRQVADLLYHLKRLGNVAVHEDAGTTSQALQALKIAWATATWFHQTYHGPAARRFKPGPFVPPTSPADATAALRAELDTLRQAVRASGDAEAQARLQAQEAEAARLTAEAQAGEREQERQFWERYAAETDAGRRAAERALAEVQATAQTAPAAEREGLAQAAFAQAAAVQLDEAATRVLIDDQLRVAGWTVDSRALRHAAGTRPQDGQAIAIAEWPTASGPADYALFVNGRCLGVIEAKRGATDVPGRLGQARRYARDIRLSADETSPGSPWTHGIDLLRVPFAFVTNGRPYVKQLATKSGIWFSDARPSAGAPRALPEWFSPHDLTARMEQQLDTAAPCGWRLPPPSRAGPRPVGRKTASP